jgi:fumarate hydratase class I
VPSPFHYQEPFPLGPDKTQYRLLTKEFVSISEFEGKPILKVVSSRTYLAGQSSFFHDINFYLRTNHLQQVAAILKDSEASDNRSSGAWLCCEMRKSPPKAFYLSVKILVRAAITAKKGQQVRTGVR